MLLFSKFHIPVYSKNQITIQGISPNISNTTYKMLRLSKIKKLFITCVAKSNLRRHHVDVRVEYVRVIGFGICPEFHGAPCWCVWVSLGDGGLLLYVVPGPFFLWCHSLVLLSSYYELSSFVPPHLSALIFLLGSQLNID